METTGKQPLQRWGTGLVQQIKWYLQENSERRFTAYELAVWYEEHNKELGRKKWEASCNINSHAELINQYAAEVSSYMARLARLKKPSRIKSTTDKPRKYYYSRNPNPETGPIDKDESKKPKEGELYPALQRFLYEELNILGVRIDVSRSRNSRNKSNDTYLFPDLAGIEIPGSDWNEQIRICAKHYHNNPRLFSFEVKSKINWENCRENFNQAVLNSSWAHIGYLVTGNIENIKDTVEELKVLSAQHGIGLILLANSGSGKSRILIDAKEKATIQWQFANRLARENPDFEEFIQSVNYFIDYGKHYGILGTTKKELSRRRWP